jgi:hypothetical protein
MSSILPALASPLSRRHKQRLREVYRSAGWPSADPLEVDLLAAGLLERRCSTEGHETLRLTLAFRHSPKPTRATGPRARRTRRWWSAWPRTWATLDGSRGGG